MTDIPLNCPLYSVLLAEENAHEAQCANMAVSPPPGLDAAAIVAAYNSSPACGNTPEEALGVLHMTMNERLQIIINDANKVGQQAGCWKEFDAKATAAQAGPLYFYAYECIYGPACAGFNFGTGGVE